MKEYEEFDLENNYSRVEKLSTILDILYLNKEKQLKICVNAHDDETLKRLFSILENEKNRDNVDINLEIKYEQDYIEDPKELDYLLEMQTRGKEYNIKTSVQLNECTCNGDIKDYFVAKKMIDEIVNKINNITVNQNGTKRPLSNTEKLAAIYYYTANRMYNINDDFKDNRMRSWIGLLTSEYAICSGYASLFKCLCDRTFNNGEVLCEIQSVNIFDKNKQKVTMPHANNLLYIKDDIYGIDGFYYCDPQAGNIYNKHDVPHLVFSMMSIEKSLKLKDLLPLINNPLFTSFYTNEQLEKLRKYKDEGPVSEKLKEIFDYESDEDIDTRIRSEFDKIKTHSYRQKSELNKKRIIKTEQAIKERDLKFCKQCAPLAFAGEIPESALFVGLTAVAKIYGIESKEEQDKFAQRIMDKKVKDEEKLFIDGSKTSKAQGKEDSLEM